MEVSYYQLVAEDKVFIVRCEREKVEDKVLIQEKRTILDTWLLNEVTQQIKANSTTEQEM